MARWPVGAAATGTLLSVFLLSLSAPIPDRAVAGKALRLAVSRGEHAVAIAGDSVLTHTSRCDADRTPLVDLLSRGREEPWINLGNQGQSFSASANYLGLALRRSNVHTAIYAMSAYHLAEHDWPSLQTQWFLRQRGVSELQANSLRTRLAHGFFLDGGSEDDHGFVYKGARYPSYDGLKSYFAREKQAQRCPESPGQQRAFIEAYYWYMYAAAPRELASNTQDLAQLSQLARTLGKRLLVVLMPADVQDVRALNEEVAAAMEAQLDEAAYRLRAAGIELLDATRTPSAEYFADRWCACGHLSERGRTWLSQRILNQLAGVDATSGR